ncbi:hypothetical protein BGW42_004194 [Actinomortierella wolfii]|nr:hypothetical protein BGW42_004194 [Actinomortierella wolfii]
MAALVSSKSLDSTLPMHEESSDQPGENDVALNTSPVKQFTSENSQQQVEAEGMLAIPSRSGDHLYRRRSMQQEKNAGRGPAPLTLANGRPRRTIPMEMQLGSSTTLGNATTTVGQQAAGAAVPLPLASPVTITAASLTALSLSSGGQSEPPSPQTPTTTGGFGGSSSTATMSSSPFSTPSSRPLSLISSVSVSTLSVPRNSFHPSSSSSATTAAATAVLSKTPIPPATDTLASSGTPFDEPKSVTSPREQNSPRAPSSSSSSSSSPPVEALLCHPPQKTAGMRPARRQTIQSDYRYAPQGNIAVAATTKNGAGTGGTRRARGHSRQTGSDAGLGARGGALSDSETFGSTAASAGGDQKVGSGGPDNTTSGNSSHTTAATTTTTANTAATTSTTTKSNVSAQLRVNLYSLVSRGYLPANITVAFREHSATITPHGTLVPIINHHHSQQDDDKEGTASSIYPWLQQEYETPSAWATAMVKGARTGKVAVNGWSAIKVPLHQDPNLVRMYGGSGQGGQSIQEVSLDVLRKKFLADLASSGEDMGDHVAGTAGSPTATAGASSKSASSSLSKASARQIAKELAMDGRKRKRQIGKGGGAGASGAGATTADANGLWILTNKLDSLAGQRQKHHSNNPNHAREQGGRVRGGDSRRPNKRSMPDYVLQDEDSAEDRQSRLEAAGTLFAMQDHFVSYRGEAGYGYKGYSATPRSTDKGASPATGGLGMRTLSHRRIELQSVIKYFQAREAKRASAAASAAVPSISVRRVTPLTLSTRRSRDVCVVCKKSCHPSNNSPATTGTSTADAVEGTSMEICKPDHQSSASTSGDKECSKCHTPAHAECIASLPVLSDPEKWLCPRCIHCTICERGLLERPPNKASHSDLKMTILSCSECPVGVHLECQLEVEPSLKAFVTAGSTCETLPKDFEWKCTSCRTCVECGYSCKNGAATSVRTKIERKQEGTPSSPDPIKRSIEGDGEDMEMMDADIADDNGQSKGDQGDQKKQVLIDGWTNAYAICSNCARLFEMGNICPLCCRLYPEDDYDTPMVFCDGCSYWVHVACDSGLAGNDYEELGKDSKQYFCPSCNPTPMPSPALSTSSSSSSSAYLPPGSGGRYGHPPLPSGRGSLQEWGRGGGGSAAMQQSRYGPQHKRDDIFDLIMAAKEISDSESRAQSPSMMDVDGSTAAAAAAAAAAATSTTSDIDSSAEVQAAEALLTIFSGSNTPVCSTPYASYPPSPYEPHFNHFGSRPSGYPPVESSMPISSPYHQQDALYRCGDCPDGMHCSHYHPYRQPQAQQQRPSTQPLPPLPQQQQPQVYASPRTPYNTHINDDYFSGQHRPSKRISYQHIGQELNHGMLLESSSSSSSTTPSSMQYYPSSSVKRDDSGYEHHHHHHHHPSHGYTAAYQHHPSHHHSYQGYTSSSSRAGSSTATTPTTPYSATTPGGGQSQSMANMYRPIQPNGGPGAAAIQASDLAMKKATGAVVSEEHLPKIEPENNEMKCEDVNDVCALCRTKWSTLSTCKESGASDILITLKIGETSQIQQDKDMDKEEKKNNSEEESPKQKSWKVHRECALWATGVLYDQETDQFANAASVVDLCQTAICSSCGKPGASIRCKASTTSDRDDRSYACAAIFHYPCVTRTAALSTSVSTHAVVVDEHERSILCRMHYREVSTLNDLRAAAAALKTSNGTSLSNV